MKEKIKANLKAVVGEANFTDRLIDLVSYSYDASEHSHRPDCGIWPQNTQHVSEICRLANENSIPVVARGAGTGLSGVTVPAEGGIVMDLNRMNRILDISIEDRCVTVQPGVVYADLDKALSRFGFFFPPDPASGKMCTLGGNVGTNAGGVKGAKYGTTRDYVLGLEVVLADGRIMRTGARTMKTVSGYDLTRLLVGSEGTLGIITEILLKVNPRPPKTKTALATFNRLSDAGRAVTEIMHSGIVPSVLEILGRQTLQAINENTDMNLPEVDAMLLVEADGYTDAEVDHQIQIAIQVFNDNNPQEVKLAKDNNEAEGLWRARKSALAVLARIKTGFILEDVTVPMGQIANLLDNIEIISEKHNVQIATYGHAGDGNLHPQIVYDQHDLDERERVHAAAGEIFKLAIALGGSLSGEHGIGISKAPFMNIEHDKVSIELMRGIKRAFDPKNILNPGKMALEV